MTENKYAIVNGKVTKMTGKARVFINRMYMDAELIERNDLYTNEEKANWFYERFNYKMNDECAKQDFYNIMLIKKNYYHIMTALLDGKDTKSHY